MLDDAEQAKAAAEAAAEETRKRAEAANAVAEEARRRAEEERKRVEEILDGMEFVWVPPGEFRMGSKSSEANDNERSRTRVQISRGYWLGKYEVTEVEWEAVMGTKHWMFSGCVNCPAVGISWDDVQEFIEKMNTRSGGVRYRLPTEAEWEYAARAGTIRDRHSEDLDAIAWYDGNSGDRIHPVGQKVPNAWGLYDMLGNVEEWVEDWYVDDLPGGSVTDPRGPRLGSYRVGRGGSWIYGASHCRSSYRRRYFFGNRHTDLGFRLLRTE